MEDNRLSISSFCDDIICYTISFVIHNFQACLKINCLKCARNIEGIHSPDACKKIKCLQCSRVVDAKKDDTQCVDVIYFFYRHFYTFHSLSLVSKKFNFIIGKFFRQQYNVFYVTISCLCTKKKVFQDNGNDSEYTLQNYVINKELTMYNVLKPETAFTKC